MIKRLKMRFLFSSGLSLFIVLVILLSIINFVNHQSMYNQLYDSIDRITDNNGKSKKKLDENNTQSNRYIAVNKKGYTVIENSLLLSDNEILPTIKKISNNKGLTSYNGYTFIYKNDNSKNIIVLVDASNLLSVSRVFLFTSIYVGIFIFALFMIMLYLISNRAIKPIVDSYKSQQEFITNASHELKTPIAIISANTEVIEMLNGENEWSTSTMNQVHRLQTLIDHLMKIVRMETISKDKEDVNISETVSSLCKEINVVINKNNIHLNTSIEDDIHIKTYRDEVTELFNILLDNASKYCEKEGEVNVNLYKKGKNIIYEVSNDYHNVNNVDVNKFFERFYREDTSHSKKGYGIGLSMAQSICESLNFKLEVKSKNNTIMFSVKI